MKTLCKCGVTFNMMAGPLAIRPFSPCETPVTVRVRSEVAEPAVRNPKVKGPH
jgi:hypothetical protein